MKINTPIFNDQQKRFALILLSLFHIFIITIKMIQRASFAPNTRTVKSVAKKMNGKVSVPHVLWNEKSSANQVQSI